LSGTDNPQPPAPFALREKGVQKSLLKPLALRERGWGEGYGGQQKFMMEYRTKIPLPNAEYRWERDLQRSLLAPLS
jgi:hypothetical protein